MLCVCVCVCVQSLQLCLTLCNPIDYSPLCSYVHRIFQARILEWVAMPSSRGSSHSRDETHDSCAGRLFTTDPMGKPMNGCCCCCCIASVVSDPVRPHRWQSTRLPYPWDSPGKNTGVGCHFLLQCMKVESGKWKWMGVMLCQMLILHLLKLSYEFLFLLWKLLIIYIDFQVKPTLHTSDKPIC